ncbi:S26 family signal peptidase [Enterobacter hormaechei]|nr:S26 family signal peptidase [Enterobacter hormaechei]MDV5555438.1 S26 family signal peptidase [Enterobacter hormaechei]
MVYGQKPFSFDSRYWGTVKNDQIIGRAYPLF